MADLRRAIERPGAHDLLEIGGLMKIQIGNTVREMTATEIAAAKDAGPPRERLVASTEAQARAIIAGAFGSRRDSVNSYFCRIAAKAPAQRSDVEKADLATLTAADGWEEAMLEYARGPALTALSLVWPAQPDGLAELVAAC